MFALPIVTVRVSWLGWACLCRSHPVEAYLIRRHLLAALCAVMLNCWPYHRIDAPVATLRMWYERSREFRFAAWLLGLASFSLAFVWFGRPKPQ